MRLILYVCFGWLVAGFEGGGGSLEEIWHGMAVEVTCCLQDAVAGELAMA